MQDRKHCAVCDGVFYRSPASVLEVGKMQTGADYHQCRTWSCHHVLLIGVAAYYSSWSTTVVCPGKEERRVMQL